MNPVVKIISSVIISINRLIDSLSLQTIETIRRGFFFLIFILCIAGIFVGVNMGKNSAKIKSDPLAEFVNDTFRIDLNREKEAGDFSGMLESEIVKESTINNFDKAEFPTRERLEPQYGKEPIESQNKIPEPDILSRPYKTETPVDEDMNRTITGNEPSVRALDKTLTDESKSDIILNRSIESEKEKTPDIRDKDKSTIKILEKDKIQKPEVINKDSGIINQ